MDRAMTLDPKNLQPGHDQYEPYWSAPHRDICIQYDYRTRDGRLFSCIAKDLQRACAKRDAWLIENGYDLIDDGVEIV